MELNDEAKQIVQDLGEAINQAVGQSTQVAEAIDRLRDAGYETELTLKLEIGLRPHADETVNENAFGGAAAAATLELTDEDRHEFRRMKIRIDDDAD